MKNINTYHFCILDKIRPAAALVDALRVDAAFDGDISLGDQLTERWVICFKYWIHFNNSLQYVRVKSESPFRFTSR